MFENHRKSLIQHYIASEASYVYMSGQKLIRNAKIEKFKCDFLGNFKTLCQYLIYDKKWPSAHFMLQRAEIPDINPLGCIINKQKSFNTSLALTWIILSPTWTKIVLFWQHRRPFSPDAFLFHLDALCLWHTPTLTQNNTPFIASRAYS